MGSIRGKKVVNALSKGKLVILIDKNEHGKLISLVEKVTPEDINFMVTHAKGFLSVAMENSRANQLDFTSQNGVEHYNYHTFTVSVDVEGTTTGISAFERHDTIKALIDPNRKSEEFKRPGHVFPVLAHENGIYGKQSHTEVSLELAKRSGSYPAVVMCDLLNEKGELSSLKEMEEFSSRFELEIMQINDFLHDFIQSQPAFTVKKKSKVKTRNGEFDLISFSNKFDPLCDQILIHHSAYSKEITPVYIHEPCDQCQLKLCDCQLNLDKALTEIKRLGGGVCIFLKDRAEENSVLTLFGESHQTLIIRQILLAIGVSEISLQNNYALDHSLLKDIKIHSFESAAIVASGRGMRRDVV
ncbi:3,4-dihydroxy-2-butanone-4-phosphate synthase [Alkalihalobacillus deserti]|uniref:3,4-dihydroxy-2-butanone-4-phosphate synthase n=1 Tax=Alkalihalobacillus deserti TaxID=2879466 RepID=UPI001D13706E|nr:3,4-dihydroxy-2-butanone-4-phosphate synthase [Alkalihalobacillus deserti]